jgi:hypothetical protein
MVCRAGPSRRRPARLISRRVRCFWRANRHSAASRQAVHFLARQDRGACLSLTIANIIMINARAILLETIELVALRLESYVMGHPEVSPKKHSFREAFTLNFQGVGKEGLKELVRLFEQREQLTAATFCEALGDALGCRPVLTADQARAL